MMNRPSIGSKWRSWLTGNYVRVKDVQGDVIVVVLNTGNAQYVHTRDFNAEYRIVEQRKSIHNASVPR